MTVTLGMLLLGLQVNRPRVFLSYHHAVDQPYYDAFSRTFHDRYETIRDNSRDRKIDSDVTDYVMRRIREEHVAGTSCTIVLCGLETRWRKYVDWEIKATLDKQHGLMPLDSRRFATPMPIAPMPMMPTVSMFRSFMRISLPCRSMARC